MKEIFHKKNLLMVLAINIISSLLTGCWDAKDVDNQNVVLTVGLDYRDNMYTFYTNIANFAKSSKEGPINIALVKGSGINFLTARDTLNRASDKHIFLGSTRVVLFSEEMAEKGIEEYVSRMRGDFEYRKTLKLITASDDLDEIFQIKPKNSIDIGYEIEQIINNMEENDTTFVTNAGKVIQHIASGQCGFLLHSIGINEESIEVNGYSVFRESKKIGFIKAEDREGIVYLLNRKKPQFGYTLHYNDIDISVHTVKRKGKEITHVYEEDGGVSISVELDMEGEIRYTSKPLSIDESIKKDLEKQLSDMIKEDIISTIKKSQELGCDYLDFYKYFRIQYPTEFKTMDWEDAYTKASVNVFVHSKLVPAAMKNINPKRGR